VQAARVFSCPAAQGQVGFEGSGEIGSLDASTGGDQATGGETASLRDRNFREYLTAVLCGYAGVQIVFIAISWHIFVLTHRAFDLGLIGFVMFVPALIFVIPSGIIADRYDRRLVVTLGKAVEIVCALTLLGLVLAGVTSVVPYLAVVALLGSERAICQTAEKAFLRNIVDAERYVNAQATYASGREIVVIAAPSIGGLLLAFSTTAAFALAAGMAVVACVAFLLLRVERDVRAPEPQTLATALAGLTFMRSRPVILGAITLDLFAVLFGGATALMPVFAATILHVGPTGLGFLRSAPAVGAAVVAAVIARRPPRTRVGALAFISVIGFGIATIAFAVSTQLWFSLLALVVLGAFDVVGGVIRNGFVQLNTPDAMRGRVTAVQSVFTTTSNELGAFESGTAAALLGTVPSVVAGGVATLAVAAICAWMFPSLRTADHFAQGATAVAEAPVS
jgi:MFS family permease